MEQHEQPQARRRVRIDLAKLEAAFENASPETHFYLDLETGQIAMVTDETWRALERLHEEIREAGDDRQAALAKALERRDQPDWMVDALAEADLIEVGYGTRYFLVPEADSREGYRDMEDFIETVQDERLQGFLRHAIRGRGAFRQFKDMLADHLPGRERWFAFKSARIRQRVLTWLEEQGIEPVPE